MVTYSVFAGVVYGFDFDKTHSSERLGALSARESELGAGGVQTI